MRESLQTVLGAAFITGSQWACAGAVPVTGPGGASQPGFLTVFKPSAKMWHILQISCFDCFTLFCANVQLLENTSEESA